MSPCGVPKGWPALQNQRPNEPVTHIARSLEAKIAAASWLRRHVGQPLYTWVVYRPFRATRRGFGATARMLTASPVKSAVDALTGLENRRAFDEAFPPALARGRRDGQPLTLVLGDLDGFKQVNDRFGHLEGNKLLRSFATRMKESCREYDYVARLGGDEFVIIAPGMGKDDARERIARLEQIALETGRQAFGEDILAVSIGEAYYVDNGSDAEQLLTEADRSMYQIKQQHYSPSRSHNKVLQFKHVSTTAAVC